MIEIVKAAEILGKAATIMSGASEIAGTVERMKRGMETNQQHLEGDICVKPGKETGGRRQETLRRDLDRLRLYGAGYERLQNGL